MAGGGTSLRRAAEEAGTVVRPAASLKRGRQTLQGGLPVVTTGEDRASNRRRAGLTRHYWRPPTRPTPRNGRQSANQRCRLWRHDRERPAMARCGFDRGSHGSILGRCSAKSADILSQIFIASGTPCVVCSWKRVAVSLLRGMFTFTMDPFPKSSTA